MGIKSSQPEAEVRPMMTYQNMVKIISEYHVSKEYEFIEPPIGRGTYAEVFRGKSIKTGNIRAIKKIDRGKHQKISTMLINEFDILRECDHPNIIKMYQLFEDYKHYYIVSELCHGTELYDAIKAAKHFPEPEACYIFYQIVSATAYLHSIGIMHRDLKPENMMYDKESRIVKLIDFGTAIRFENGDLMERRCVGTAYYVAPEVLKKKYNQKCDVWSLGVILYILLSGRPPFTGKTDEEIMKNVLANEVAFTHPEWEKVSAQAKGLVQQMLDKSVEQRISARSLMSHEWFSTHLKKNLSVEDESLMIRCLTNMKKFEAMKSNKIQEGMLIYIISFIKGTEDDKFLYKCFKNLDLNGDGVLNREELRIGFERHLKMNPKDADLLTAAVFDKIDFNLSDSIDYSEFIISAIDLELAVTDKNLDIAFDYIDTDSSGTLDMKEIRAKLGENIEEEVYLKLLKEFDSNGDGQIDRKEFKKMMLKLLNQKTTRK